MAKKLLRFRADGRYAILKDMKYAEELQDLLSFSPPGYRFSWKYKQGIWDGKISVLKHGVMPIGVLRSKEVKQLLADDGFNVKLTRWDNRPACKMTKGFNEASDKYNYQNECVRAMLNAVTFGGGLVLSATGTGKTKIAAQFTSWIKSPCLFVVDQIDLLYQSAKEIEDWLKIPVGVVGNSKFQPSDRITIATIQTLHKHSDKPLFRRWLKTIKIVIIDELHVQMNFRNFSVINLIEPDAVFGLTATLQLKRKDIRLKAFSIAGPVLYEFPVIQGMNEQVLSKGVGIQIDVPGPPAEDMPKGLSPKARMMWLSDQYNKLVVNNYKTNKAIVKFVTYALDKGYYCVVLVERIEHIKNLEAMFEARGHTPAVAYGAVGTNERQKIRKRFEKGREDLILANTVFKKGINLKRVDLIVDAAQRGNKNDTMQKLGRAARLHVEKRGFLFYHVNTAPALDKHAKKRQSVIKKSKIPVAKVTLRHSADALKAGENLLTKFIKRPKDGDRK